MGPDVNFKCEDFKQLLAALVRVTAAANISLALILIVSSLAHLPGLSPIFLYPRHLIHDAHDEGVHWQSGRLLGLIWIVFLPAITQGGIMCEDRMIHSHKYSARSRSPPRSSLTLPR